MSFRGKSTCRKTITDLKCEARTKEVELARVHDELCKWRNKAAERESELTHMQQHIERVQKGYSVELQSKNETIAELQLNLARATSKSLGMPEPPLNNAMKYLEDKVEKLQGEVEARAAEVRAAEEARRQEAARVDELLRLVDRSGRAQPSDAPAAAQRHRSQEELSAVREAGAAEGRARAEQEAAGQRRRQEASAAQLHHQVTQELVAAVAAAEAEKGAALRERDAAQARARDLSRQLRDHQQAASQQAATARATQEAEAERQQQAATILRMREVMQDLVRAVAEEEQTRAPASCTPPPRSSARRRILPPEDWQPLEDPGSSVDSSVASDDTSALSLLRDEMHLASLAQLREVLRARGPPRGGPAEADATTITIAIQSPGRGKPSASRAADLGLPWRDLSGGYWQ